MADHQRLREERERLGMTQIELGSVGGIREHDQCRYEIGIKKFDANYLIAIAAVGADVLYILTGQRTERLLPSQELALLDDYRVCDDDAKRIIEGSANLSSQ